MDLSSIRDSQLLGQAEEEDAVISLVLKKEYCDIDESNDNRLLWKSHVEKVLKSGTLTRLVQQLAPHGEEIDHSYRTSFLAVYRTFATPTELLHELIEWYKKLHSIDKENKAKETYKGVTLRSVLSFVRLWLEKYISDFDTPPSYNLLMLLEGFLTEESKNLLLSTEASELLRHVLELKQKLMSTDRMSLVRESSNSEERAIDDYYDWLKFLPVQIAWDLTALDAYMFGTLVPHECLHYIRKKTDHSPTIYQTIQHFNKIICLVITTVLQPNVGTTNFLHFSSSYEGELSLNSFTSDDVSMDDLDQSVRSDSCTTPSPCSMGSSTQRGRCISHWIDIAQQCRLLKNFSSLKAIVFGLQSSSVSRLAQSWVTVSIERQTIFKELLDLFSSDSNFQIFRDVVNKEATGKRADVSPHKRTRLLKNTGTCNTNNDIGDVVIGIIPYLGTFLSDLTMLHNALPDKNKDGQINFEKRRKEFEILAKISLFQTASSKYDLPRNPSLYHWIYHTPLLSENESYHLSVQLEPSVLSPSVNKSSSPLCETIIRRSLRFLKQNGKKTTALSVPTDPRIRKSFDVSVDMDNGSTNPCDEDGTVIYRSSSCMELNEHVVVRVTIKEQHDTCVYKSIYLSKSDHTSKVIQTALDKHGLSIADADKYQLCQQLNGKSNNKEKLSLIPAGACVYYALDATIQPKLYVQLKES